MPSPNNVELNYHGRLLSLETGKLAKEANGAVVVRYADTIVLVTATASTEAREGISFFPLIVDFEEKLYAAGKIPGGFFKREGRPSEKAILTSRLIDRPLRPLFPSTFRKDVQIMATVFSADQENPPDILAMLGASAALVISDIPLLEPIGSVRIGRVNNRFIINPTNQELLNSSLDLIVSATKNEIVMIEGTFNQSDEKTVLEALHLAKKEILPLINLQESLGKRCGKPKQEVGKETIDENLKKWVEDFSAPKIKEYISVEKIEQRESLRQLLEEEIATTINNSEDENLKTAYNKKPSLIKPILDILEKKTLRRMILDENKRIDHRGLKEIRSISCETGVLPRAHGSGLFTRGQTQVLTITTLGTASDEQIIDGLGLEESKRYMHHYNFPPFSVGEVKINRGPGRREIGHGALAERALLAVLPTEDEFPYTIRLVSEVLESNGSTSMASTCGSTLALMDAGVPIKKPVAGISIGLIKEENRFTLLSDIIGLEDHFGDMDFKITGTKDGITAIQLDLKIQGLAMEIIEKAIYQAKEARLFILEKMEEVMPQPRQNLSIYAPRISTMMINPDKIGEVIGPGGKVIKKIIEETGVKIDIEDDGRVHIFSTDPKGIAAAKARVEELTREVKVGNVYTGKVTRITNFGAFVSIFPGKEGLVHISQIADRRVEDIKDYVNLGDEVLVKVIEVDENGRVNLSMKGINAAFPETRSSQ